MTMTSSINPLRGEVWQVSFDPAVGSEIQKNRPAVVVSPNSVSRLPLRIVVPLTDWDERWRAYLWMVEIPKSGRNGLSKNSSADAFQVKSLSTGRFLQKRGDLRAEQVDDIAAAVAICVGFNP